MGTARGEPPRPGRGPRSSATAATRFDSPFAILFIAGMANEIIDITRYFKRDPEQEVARGSMALWGADGERSRFALPLWRIIHLARAERGLIVWQEEGAHEKYRPFVVLDLGADPARTSLEEPDLPSFGSDDSPGLIDREERGLVIHLGSRRGRTWLLVVDGASERTGPLVARAREDVLFLAGECAGLLFLRELADDGAAFSEEDE